MWLRNLNESKGVTVENGYGVELDFDAVVNLMDDDIREEVHAEGIDDPQEFWDRYVELYNERNPRHPLDEPGGLDSPNPQY